MTFVLMTHWSIYCSQRFELQITQGDLDWFFLWMDIPDLGMIHRVHSVHLARVESHHVKYCSILQLFVTIKWWILSVSFNGKMYLFAFLWSLYAGTGWITF